MENYPQQFGGYPAQPGGYPAQPGGYPAEPAYPGGPGGHSGGGFPEGKANQVSPLAGTPLVGQAAVSGQEQFHDPTGKYKLVMQGSYAAVEAALTPGDSVKAESGAMVTMSSNVRLEAKLEGSAAGACFRSCCAGESLFMSHFSLQQGGRGDVLLAPAVPGDIVLIHMDGTREWAIQKSSYFASDASVSVGVKTQSIAAGCCSGEGFFILRASGQGRLLVNSFGGIMRFDLRPGEVRKIDNGYLVAWHAELNYTIGKAGSSLINSFLSGEGLVCTFTGPGTIWVQTRSVIGLANVLRPYFPASGGGGAGAISFE